VGWWPLLWFRVKDLRSRSMAVEFSEIFLVSPEEFWPA
jgi:hypothetical protein